MVVNLILKILFESFFASLVISEIILLKKTDDCYNVLGLLHQKYSYVPGRFKDYISTPKPNGYQSLHTTLIGPVNRRIEIQVRTFKMNDQADLGVAAHWIYKEKVDKNILSSFKKAIKNITDFHKKQIPKNITQNKNQVNIKTQLTKDITMAA